MTGGEDRGIDPCMAVFLYRDRRVMWHTLWTFHMGGSQRWYVSGDKTCEISKGPCHLGNNFLEG